MCKSCNITINIFAIFIIISFRKNVFTDSSKTKPLLDSTIFKTDKTVTSEIEIALRTKRGLSDKLGQIALVSIQSITGEPCAVRKFWLIYLEISSVGECDRCDKYFHCRANYDAIHTCMREDPDGDLAKRIKTAEEISNAREYGQNGKIDSEEDQRANRFGRGGGNCAKEYLYNYGCFYDPWRKLCKKHG